MGTYVLHLIVVYAPPTPQARKNFWKNVAKEAKDIQEPLFIGVLHQKHNVVGENASGQVVSSDGKNDAYDEVDDIIAKYVSPVVGGKKDDIGVCPAVDSEQTISISRHESKQGFCGGDDKYEEASSGPEWSKHLKIQLQQQTADLEDEMDSLLGRGRLPCTRERCYFPPME
ncbi:hypothetical protein V2J09_014081 [Rumex salicifolius]